MDKGPNAAPFLPSPSDAGVVVEKGRSCGFLRKGARGNSDNGRVRDKRVGLRRKRNEKCPLRSKIEATQ
jgi:hypothetical protein